MRKQGKKSEPQTRVGDLKWKLPDIIRGDDGSTVVRNFMKRDFCEP
jgi:hypothetical protein